VAREPLSRLGACRVGKRATRLEQKDYTVGADELYHLEQEDYTFGWGRVTKAVVGYL